MFLNEGIEREDEKVRIVYIPVPSNELLPSLANGVGNLARSGKVFFEVAETAAIDKMSVAQHFKHSLKEFGCKFSLDDFGVGHIVRLRILETCLST
jgi:EAL domain-containing protein (putative c-di-GMP-specific phosphodiesterase class I)